MRGVWGFVLSARPWLIGFVVWVVVAAEADVRNPHPSSSLVIGMLLTFFIGTAGFVRVLWPMRAHGNPPKLVAAARPYEVHTYTGHVGGASKTAYTTFSAQSSVNQNPITGDLSHRMSTSQQTTVQDDLTLHGANGTQHNVQVKGVNLSVGAGQLVSAAWAVRPGHKSGRYMMFRNHTTGQNAYPFARLWWLATGVGVIGYLMCMWFGAVLLAIGGAGAFAAVWFFVVPFVYIGLGYYRAIRFRGGGSKAISTFLDGVAATFTQPAAAAPVSGAAPIAAEPSAASVGSSPVPPSSAPPPPPALNAPPAWLADPTGRHDHRFWDGSAWTDQVADAGVPAIDRL